MSASPPQAPRRPRRALRRLAALLPLAIALASCASHQLVGTPSDQAKAQYQKGLDYFQDENYLEAINALNVVRTKHPYSSYATLAELKIADSQFELGKYIEAAAAYRSFVRFHPHHDQRAYAMFRVGECYFKQIPGDWWFMPPAFERELTSTTDALRELEAFTSEYPQDQLVKEADKRIGDLRHRLAEYEMFVARFYWREKKPKGTVMRLDHLLKHFAQAGFNQEALLLKAEAHQALGELAEARQNLDRLVREYPQSKEADEARDKLAVLPQAPPAPPAPEATPAPAAAPAPTPAAPSADAPASPPAPEEAPPPTELPR